MKLVYYPHESLLTACTEVVSGDLDLNTVLDDMKRIMLQHEGIGLAANQVGITKRIFIMKDLKGKIWEFINPVIVFKDDVQYQKEGCLSLPGVAIEISRAKQVSLKAYDRFGNQFSVGCTGIEAVCVQHEMEHLDGIFYIDKLSRQEKRRILREAKKSV